MGVEAKENNVENFGLGLYVKDAPSTVTFSTLIDDVGNILKDGSGNSLRAKD